MLLMHRQTERNEVFALLVISALWTLVKAANEVYLSVAYYGVVLRRVPTEKLKNSSKNYYLGK